MMALPISNSEDWNPGSSSQDDLEYNWEWERSYGLDDRQDQPGVAIPTASLSNSANFPGSNSTVEQSEPSFQEVSSATAASDSAPSGAGTLPTIAASPQRRPLKLYDAYTDFAVLRRPYPCDRCFKKSKTLKDLGIHYMRDHERTKIFTCHCGWKRARHDDLLNHRKICDIYKGYPRESNGGAGAAFPAGTNLTVQASSDQHTQHSEAAVYITGDSSINYIGPMTAPARRGSGGGTETSEGPQGTTNHDTPEGSGRGHRRQSADGEYQRMERALKESEEEKKKLEKRAETSEKRAETWEKRGETWEKERERLKKDKKKLKRRNKISRRKRKNVEEENKRFRAMLGLAPEGPLIQSGEQETVE
ncbi:hypothetical protein TWF481_005311 [Arthrobotrys musiformis]|uniref:C2H2-type domain-containing protein n=1 Tax=Arthrobotrys musiformis TaxID=47236 RepID=A0AAV9WEB8_9PEZI